MIPQIYRYSPKKISRVKNIYQYSPFFGISNTVVSATNSGTIWADFITKLPALMTKKKCFSKGQRLQQMCPEVWGSVNYVVYPVSENIRNFMILQNIQSNHTDEKPLHELKCWFRIRGFIAKNGPKVRFGKINWQSSCFWFDSLLLPQCKSKCGSITNQGIRYLWEKNWGDLIALSVITTQARSREDVTGTGIGWWRKIAGESGGTKMSNVQNPYDIPLYWYWLVNRDPYIGLLWSLYNGVVCHPLYTANNQGQLVTAQMDGFPGKCIFGLRHSCLIYLYSSL